MAIDATNASSWIIDCRSDTVTKPSRGMRKMMAEAEVGDDVFGEDVTVRKLEKKVAEMLGKEAGLFVASGTMANLIAVMVHCWERGLGIVLGDKSHIHLYEQGGVAQYGGVHQCAVLANRADGTFDVDGIREKSNDPHRAVTTLVCIENSHNACGGKAVPLEWVDEVGEACRRLDLKLHCDGARLLNAASALGVTPERLVRTCDSVSICLSKGLGAPVGSVIVGNVAFVEKAKRVRKSLGGGMRQVGILAAAGLYALEHNVLNLGRDNAIANHLAKVVNEVGDGLFSVDIDHILTNMVFIEIDPKVTNAKAFCQRLEMMPRDEIEHLNAEVVVRSVDFSARAIRIAIHLDVLDEMAKLVEQKLRHVIGRMLKD